MLNVLSGHSLNSKGALTGLSPFLATESPDAIYTHIYNAHITQYLKK